MANYKLSNDAREDLIRIHQYGIQKFGVRQADKYFHAFFECFDRIALNPYHFESVDHIKMGYRRFVCGVDSIYYRINNDTVEIISIIGRQDVNQILK
ncbi:type II toxin-antitoxin system RelE/ParE family toxin [Fulvivirga sedimenti]|uniref:Toxin n=1 Tax=Fulvivirga sedimenti TaxID=2879465 RepID=A0A9X1HPZ6_9BACT|nr:type II toxin-antitoxin system RelE/ParE family toxin [Fulvivirga sedimenti]MCA6075006.1 type II toxin-antitoxin system RelE/ParE family toxin [Fulvivirga sedimenti]MCA6076183.1 type II toxin-antitoxin system RelE/ParE family toxin [Fulvivirga sedimenti]MCA6077311.1 type II toxin-antitoxin system RelE/ParE family toxin [Fulvivirga sedimenti]